MQPDGEPPRRKTFSKRMRLTRARDFEALRAKATKRLVGPLVVFGRSNDRGYYRMGLGVSRRVGSAVVRNQIKRRLREAFRLLQHNLPGSYDILISVRPHQPLNVDDYQQLIQEACQSIHERWLNSTHNPNTDDPASSHES